MREINTDKALEAVIAAKVALSKGDHAGARHHARLAVELDPGLEDSWLVLAAIASPGAAVAYLQKALEINPSSDRAKKAMDWALQKQNKQEPPPPSRIQFPSEPVDKPKAVSSPDRPGKKKTPLPELPRLAASSWVGVRSEEHYQLSGITFPKVRAKEISQRRIKVIPWLLFVVALCLGGFGLISAPPRLKVSADNLSSTLPTGVYIKPSYTPTPTSTFTPTPTPTNTPTPTVTPSPTVTPIPTDTPIPPPVVVDSNVYEPGNIPNVGKKERWIDVDLSSQTVSAYEGKNVVNTFLVSTGTWQHPTVTGKYKIYVKYRYTNMAGPGYFLPDVPYTMYFYDGYGLHGTYWHSNFGTPMSHGCINLETSNAAWLYNWADVGTVVNIHD